MSCSEGKNYDKLEIGENFVIANISVAKVLFVGFIWPFIGFNMLIQYNVLIDC